ncbi:MAG: hypothetical protein WCO65_03895 [bacterium]
MDPTSSLPEQKEVTPEQKQTFAPSRTFTPEELVVIKERLKLLDLQGARIAYPEETMRDIYEKHNKMCRQNGNLQDIFKRNLGASEQKQNAKNNIRDEDDLFFRFFKINPLPYPQRGLCSICQQSNPDIMCVNPLFSRPVKRNMTPPSDIPKLEWVHIVCKKNQNIEHSKSRRIGTPGYEFDISFKNSVFNCQGKIKGEPCPKNIGNTGPEHFHYDHKNPLDKVANIGKLLAVFEQVDRDEFLYELSKCEMLCTDCHASKTEDQRLITTEKRNETQTRNLLAKEAKIIEDAANIGVTEAKEAEKEVNKKRRNREKAARARVSKKAKILETQELSDEAKLVTSVPNDEDEACVQIPNIQFPSS